MHHSILMFGKKEISARHCCLSEHMAEQLYIDFAADHISVHAHQPCLGVLGLEVVP